MKKIETVNVCYVRVNEHYRNYMLSKYGNPIITPTDHPISALLREQLVNNPMLVAQNNSRRQDSYSDLAFNYQSKGQIFDIEICTPKEAEKHEFVAMVIPDEVRKFSKFVATSASWQLSVNGVNRLKGIISEEFWTDLRIFIDECFHRASITKEKTTKEKIISDFMIIHDIPMHLFENFVRYEKRNKKTALDVIEKKRDMLEERTGRVFLYT